MRLLQQQKMNGASCNAQLVSTEHKSIINDKLVPCSSFFTILHYIFKFSIMHILIFDGLQTKYFKVKLRKHSISTRQCISNNIFFTLLVFNDIRESLNEFNPFGMSTIQFCLTFNMFQRFMIRMYNKFFGP